MFSLLSTYDNTSKPSCVTPFSAIHFSYGVLFAFFTISLLKLQPLVAFILWFSIHTVYEMKDYYHSYDLKLTDYIHSNSFANSLGDQVVAMAGFGVGYLYLTQTGQTFTFHDMLVLIIILGLIQKLLQVKRVG